ncbi:UNVERIFIED_CONTAM: putative mitochondrial protein [Sesamum radiatum]|uniref:Mitochondrial protein n=1 Tax=Sesamum radiatum TaxID=300843 RepID=A0AAW2L512_SESRA
MAMSRQGSQVSHLFADDTLVFCQASHEALQSVGRILGEFEVASGLMVNLKKSSVAFSRNVPKNRKNDLASVLGIRLRFEEGPLVILAKLCASKQEGGLGFRKLGLFNPAMLAKQIWRIITNPDSLLSRMLKQKYYPNSEVLLATVGPGSSITWRSILAARELFLAGMRWHIGIGQGVCIWKDKWIPRPLSFQVVTTPNTLGEDAKVEELFD